MRPIAFAVFGMVAILIVPEGLSAAWSAELGGGPLLTVVIVRTWPTAEVIAEETAVERYATVAADRSR